jgi:hypothetical protein
MTITEAKKIIQTQDHQPHALVARATLRVGPKRAKQIYKEAVA